MIRSRFQKNCQGFTLMEILVVLVMVSLISALLMDGFGYVLRLRGNVTQEIKKLQLQQLQEHWYRNLVAGLLTNPIEEPAVFNGNASQFEGQSINTLDAPLGVPNIFSLSLVKEATITQLKYRDHQNNDWTLGEWEAQTAYFSYLDDQGNWISDWPPKLGASPTQLPLAIQLHIEGPTNPIDWIASIPGEKNPKPPLEEFL